MARSFHSVTLLFVSVVFLVVAGLTAWKGYEKYREKEKVANEVLRLREEANRIKSETERLDERIAYMRTPEYTEREVKGKLNLKKPEENVAVVRSAVEVKNEEKRENVSDSISAQLSVKTDESNVRKWRDFFFAPQGR